MKTSQSSKTPHHTIFFKKYSVNYPTTKRSFSSSKPITSRLLFPQFGTTDTVTRVMAQSKSWSEATWNSHRPLLAKLISTADPYELITIYVSIYALDKHLNKRNRNEQRWQYNIAKQNNDYVHALASPGSNLPIWFNSSDVPR